MSGGDDDVLRILHTSDWHLGCPFKSFLPRERTRLTGARYAALENLFGVARRERVHAVLCAGDLFDEPTPREGVWRPLVKLLQAQPESCPVVLLPGNHDPLTEGAIWQPTHPFRKSLPRHVQVVDRDDFQLELPEGGRILSVPTRSRRSARDPLDRLPPRPEGDTSIRMGLVHGQTLRIDGQAANHPVDPSKAAALGLDYLALGDTHGTRQLSEPGRPPIYYSGTPEPMSFGEQGAGQVLLVSFRRRSRAATVRPIEVGCLQWQQVELDSWASLDAFLSQVQRQSVVWLKMKGRYDPETHDRLSRRLEDFAGDEDVEGLVAACRLERRTELDTSGLSELLQDAPEALQEAARRLEARRSTGAADAEVVERALARLVRIAKELRS